MFNTGLDLNGDVDARDPWWTLDVPISFTAGLDDVEAGPITVPPPATAKHGRRPS